MSSPMAPAAAIGRSAAVAAAGLAVLVVPGLPAPAAAAVAALAGFAAAWWLALAGRARLDSVELRFVPPELPTLGATSAAPALAETPAPTGTERIAVAPVPVPVPLPTAAQTQFQATPSDIVTLGSSADPAFPSWRLHWQLPDGREGLVVLPTGERTVLGRQSDCHIVVQLDEVSRNHLIFQVARQSVRVTETGSSNGTWYRSAGDSSHTLWTRLPAGAPHVLAASDQLRIADPWAIVLTLESAVRS